MNFFSGLVTLLIILLVIAAITAPGDQKFTDFINTKKGGDTMRGKPIIGKSTEIKLLIRMASVKYISYCETYLGLFGRF